MTTTSLEAPKEITKKKSHVNSHIKQKEYRVRVFANDDVYESTVLADRLSIVEQSLVFYSKVETIIAVFPACRTEVTRVTDPTAS